VAEALEDLQSLAMEFGLKSSDLYTEKRRLATFFLVYKEDDRQALDHVMDEFKAKIQGMGIELRAADFKDS
jgi:hypothetical protein